MGFDDEKIKKALGQNIKVARLNLNLTQDELSESIDISTQLLKDIEGGRRFGSMNTFIKICLALKTIPNNMLYEMFKENEDYDENLVLKINTLSNRDKKLLNILIDNMCE